MEKVIFLLLNVFVLSSFSQTLIPGSINTAMSLPNVERNFTGFNSGQGHIENIYKIYKANSGLEVNSGFYDVFANLGTNITWRFPGGTTANFYNRWGSGYGNAGIGQTFGDSWNYSNINTTVRNSNYGDYNNYNTASYPNSKSNVIFPFINSITKNKSVTAKSVFCLNFINHYRNVPWASYDSRKETLKDTAKIEAIIDLDGNYLDAFNASTLSKDFKKIVRQNIDAFLTLINNGISVYKVEMGNEVYAYAYDDNLISDYNSFFYNSNFLNPSDTKVWYKDDGSEESIQNSYSTLWTYVHLAKLYRVLLTDTLQKLSTAPLSRNNSIYTDHLNNIKFGLPISFKLDGGFKRWNDFMLQPDIKAYVGADAYILHPYLDSSNYFKELILSPITNSSITDLANEFNDIRDTIETSYNKRFFKTNQVNLINALPSGSEVWYTEWNFNFDNNNLKKVGNTLLHAMYYYDVMMNFFDINANKNLSVACNKANPIKLCNYQIPYAKDATWYNMTRFIKGYDAVPSDPYTTTNSVAKSIEYNSPYYVHLLLSPILEDATIQYVNNSNGGFDSVPECSFRSFYKKECVSACCRDNIYIYFNNKSESDYEIDLMSGLGINNMSCVEATKNYLYANNLYASMGQTTFRADDFLYTDTLNNAADITIQRVFNQEIADSMFHSVLIPKYSLGYVKVSVTIPSEGCACGAAARKKANSDALVTINADPALLFKKAEETRFSPVIHLYPNPIATGNLSIDIPSIKDIRSEIRIFDLTGNLVRSFSKELSAGQNSIQLDLMDLAKSAYLIRIDGEGIHFTDKIIVQ